MRWRFLDRIDHYEPWVAARGLKAVSLEEYRLLEPLGRQGVLPEVLLLEAGVQLARWLVLRSSDFQQSCLLTAVTDFAVTRPAGRGCRLAVAVRTVRRAGDDLDLDAVVGDPDPLARGAFAVALVPVAGLADPQDLRALWRELHGQA